MYQIMKAEKLADKIFLMDVHAPRVAQHCAAWAVCYCKNG